MDKYEHYKALTEKHAKEVNRQERSKLTDVVVALFYRNYETALEIARLHVPQHKRFDNRKKEWVSDEAAINSAAEAILAKARAIISTAFELTPKQAVDAAIAKGTAIEIDAHLFQEIAYCGEAFRAVRKGRAEKVKAWINATTFKDKYREDRVKLKMVRIIEGTDTCEVVGDEPTEDHDLSQYRTDQSETPWE